MDVYDPGVLWQCTTCGACEDACPVGIEHTPVIIGARRGLVSNGEAPEYLAPIYNNLERRGNLWGQTSDVRQKFVASAQFETFDPAKHEYLLWLGCAGGTEPDFQKSLRSLAEILRAQGKTFGVLSKERCTGDVAKRTGNEYQFQELAAANVGDLQDAGVKKVVTSCPHCLKTLGHDYRQFGFEGKVVHSSVLVEEITRHEPPLRLEEEAVTFHDPCYLGRYAGEHEAPRALLERYGGDVAEPERTKDNPFCCGAGGGLLFEEHEAGTRISQARFEQLQATGANTIVMGCPFCSIMLKGAKASTPDTDAIQMVDLMTWTEGRLRKAGRLAQADRRVRCRARGVGARVSDRPAWEGSASKRRQVALIARIGTPLVAALGRTWRYTSEGAEAFDQCLAAGQRPILALWHGRILPATPFWRDRGIVAITSENFDGEWIARIMQRFGYAAARGSTSRGGVKALVQLKRLVGEGHPTAFTVDGPRGPAGRAQPGALWLAKATGQPILPFHIEAASAWHAQELGPRPGAAAVLARRRGRRAAVLRCRGR